jgi:hypothetical protein
MGNPERRASACGTRSLLVFAAVISFTVAACSGDGLSEDLVAATTLRVADVLETAQVQLDGVSAECTARRLTDAEAVELTVEPMAATLAATLAQAAVECAGSTVIARAALAPLAVGAADRSIECAAENLDQEFVVGLLAANLTSEVDDQPLVELEVATALGLCLSPEELLDQSS